MASGMPNTHGAMADRAYIGLPGLLAQHLIGQDDKGSAASLEVAVYVFSLPPLRRIESIPERTTR